MTGSVIYACKCLNLKLQLDSKYRLEGHEKMRDHHLFKLDNPPLCGWQFEVTKVTIQFRALIQFIQTQGWTTVHCRNCPTGNVYSFKGSSVHPDLKKVVVRKGCVLNREIRWIEKSPGYSTTFRIVLRTPAQVEVPEKDCLDPRWPKEQKEIQQRLKKTLRLLEKEKEEKVQEFIQEQIILLRAAKEKASQEGQLLWQTIQTLSPSCSPPSSDLEEDSQEEMMPLEETEHPHYSFTPSYNPAPHPLATASDHQEGMFPLDEDIPSQASSRSVPQLNLPRGESWFKHHDLTEADKNLSSQFAPYRRRTMQDLSLFYGRIIPPHILAENTAANEKETLFGSLPNQRRQSSCRPID